MRLIIEHEGYQFYYKHIHWLLEAYYDHTDQGFSIIGKPYGSLMQYADLVLDPEGVFLKNRLNGKTGKLNKEQILKEWEDFKNKSKEDSYESF